MLANLFHVCYTVREEVNTLKERIRIIRKDLKLNQTEFGKELGCSQTAVAKYESGMVIPDQTLRKLICQKFNVNESWLETGEGVPYKEGLVPGLVNALRTMPAVQAALERLLPRLTPEDLEHINALVEKMLEK